MRRICVYAASSPGADPGHGERAERFGGILARRGLEMVYGGGRLGVMGRAAEGVLREGGAVTGVIPRFMKERVHPGLTRTEFVETMHERKARMASLAEGFAVLPGGMGTLEEAAEALTWIQLGLHAKPVGFLNARGYFDSLFSWFDRAAAEGFLRPEHRAMILAEEDGDRLLRGMERFRPPPAILRG